MKSISIYSIASCNTTSREGRYHALLKYKDNYKKLSNVISDTTTNRCIIQGCIDALTFVKEPCLVEFITATPMGILMFLKKGKGTNKDLIGELLLLLDEKECEYKFTALEGEGEALKEIVHSVIK